MKQKKQLKYILTLYIILSIILYFILSKHPSQLIANIFFGNKGKATYENSGIKKEVGLRAWRESSVKGVSASDGIFTNKIQIIWNSKAGADIYYVYRSLFSSTTYKEIAKTTSTAYNDSVTSCRTYHYKVRADSALAGYSLYSSSDDGFAIITNSFGSGVFLDNNTFQVVATGVWPAAFSNAQKIIKRTKAQEDAILKAQNGVRQLFSEMALEAIGGGPLDPLTIAIIQGYSVGGFIVQITFYADDSCTIVYRIQDAGLKQKAEAGFQ